MDIILVTIVSLFVSALTFFSGFGLGTLLLPVFALFFPVEIAVAATAIVHFANNVFKLILVGKNADKSVTISFIIPAIIAAFIGAWLLGVFSGMPPFYSYEAFGRHFSVYPVKLVIGILMIIFALLEVLPVKEFTFGKKTIPLGGFLSGFFGGLSGHQGALRTAFLMRSGLTKEALIGTMVVCGFAVDLVRLIVYGSLFSSEISLLDQEGLLNMLFAGCLAAFVGSYFGKYLFDKVTFKIVRSIIMVMLLIFGLAFALGVI